ncbi:MAG: hypothetical protein ACU83U_14425 [Gammaproteobacteria bacterium]
MSEKSIRSQVRYERNDIDAVFKKTPVFFNQFQPVKIINISKQGIAICSHQALKANNRLELKLCFVKGESFFLNGLVVHAFDKQSNALYDEFVELFFDGAASPLSLPFKYGIHFERQYSQFRDYLVESGCKNGFEIQRCDKSRWRRRVYQR